jgi:hypothetical protein
MSFRYGILNLLVLSVVLVLFFENYDIWTQTAQWVPQRGGVKKVEKKPEPPPAPAPQKEATPIKSYVAIAEKNIFNPERKDFPAITSSSPAADQAKKTLVRPQIMLYGVTTYGDSPSAIISVPGTSSLRKGERESLTVKLGERIGEFRLTKILADRIMMEASEDSFEVLLYDPKAPRQRTHIKTEAKPAAVISTVPGATSPPATPAPAKPGSSLAPPAVTKPTVPTPTPKASPPAVAPPPVSPATPPASLPRPRYRRVPGASPTQPQTEQAE